MNIHPIFVHFPIALLTVYALLECVWSAKLRASDSLFWSKFTLLTTGFLGACAALLTGDGAEHAVGHSVLVEMHSTFGAVTTWVFAVILAVYLVRLYQRYPNTRLQTWIMKHSFVMKIYTIKCTVAEFIFKTPLIYILALIGLICVTITGALGGAIVYGPDADPIVHFIYHLFLN